MGPVRASANEGKLWGEVGSSLLGEAAGPRGRLREELGSEGFPTLCRSVARLWARPAVWLTLQVRGLPV